MKTNFKKIKSDDYSDEIKKEFKRELTPEEFEEYVVNSGARGSFMIYRSKNKDEELGLDELWVWNIFIFDTIYKIIVLNMD